jgi:hypothetical protein
MRLLILTLVCAVLAAAATAAASAAPRVTVISDSVLTSVTWHDDNMAILDDGFDMDVHVAICRRLAVPGCVSDGEAPPSLFDVLAGLPDVAPTVVVEMGYNDDPARFQADVEETIARLTARGAARIVWPTLSVMPSAFQSEFQAKNDILVQELAREPRLTLVDWGAYSLGRWPWFQTDNLHLTTGGGSGIATLLHQALASPPSLPRQVTLPPARSGVKYSARLGDGFLARGTWEVVSGSLPSGLRLEPSGLVAGTPRTAGPATLGLVFHTSDYELVYQQADVRVAPAPRPAAPKQRKVVKSYKKALPVRTR